MNRNKLIKKLLEDKNVSQEKLASILGVSRTAINERLNAEREIDSYSFIDAVSKLTGKSIQFIVTGIETKADNLSDSSAELEVLKELVESQKETIQLLKKEIDRLNEKWKKTK